MDDKKVGKNSNLWVCKLCNYTTTRSDNYKNHLLTVKHKKQEISKNWITLDDGKVGEIETKEFVCLCGKSYKYRQGLFKHQQKCNTKQPITLETQKSGVSDELVCQLVKDNTEMKKLFGDLVNVIKDKDKQLEILTNKFCEMKPSMGNNNNNNNNTNNFNINMFLNEQCKDAINMTDFVKSIQVSFEQLDYTKVNGLEK